MFNQNDSLPLQTGIGACRFGNPLGIHSIVANYCCLTQTFKHALYIHYLAQVLVNAFLRKCVLFFYYHSLGFIDVLRLTTPQKPAFTAPTCGLLSQSFQLYITNSNIQLTQIIKLHLTLRVISPRATYINVPQHWVCV